MTNSTIDKLGGHQYKVTIGEETEIVDLDGYTIMSDEDYKMIEDAGLLDINMVSPSTYNFSGTATKCELEAIAYAANYTGFDAKRYIEDMNG